MKDVYGLPTVVAVNRFPTDTDAEVQLVIEECAALGVKAILSDVWAKGGEGGRELAQEVVRLCDGESDFKFSYDLSGGIEDKLTTITRRVYGGAGISVTPAAKNRLNGWRRWASVRSLSVLPKPSTAFRMTPRSSGRRRASP